MPLNLAPAFEGVPGIYVIGAHNPRDVKGREVYWKVGMASSIKSRLNDYAICFPEGFWIRMLLTLPTPQARWRGAIDKVVTKIERTIHDELDRPGSGATRSTIVHRKGEWFKARFSDIYRAIARVLFRLGLQDRVKLHNDLADDKYGVDSGAIHIPKGELPRLEDVVPSAKPRPITDPMLKKIPKHPAEDREYAVERIVAKKGTAKSPQYLVKWKGWPMSDNSWEPAAALKHAQVRIAQFEERSRQLGRGHRELEPQRGGALWQWQREKLENEAQELRARIAQATPQQRVAAIADLKARIGESEHRVVVNRWHANRHRRRLDAREVALTESEEEEQEVEEDMDADEEEDAYEEDDEAELVGCMDAIEYYKERARLLNGLMAEVEPQQGTGRQYELHVGPIQRLAKQAGTRVLIGLRPNKRANYAVYQNIRVRIGDDRYDYSEAWSMGSSKKQFDFFSVPADLRGDAYTSTADMWIEPGGIDPSYQSGAVHDAESPWGLARGRWEMREPPEGAAVTTRTTTLRWQDGEMVPPQETRQIFTYVG
jgi:hypothetical protein